MSDGFVTNQPITSGKTFASRSDGTWDWPAGLVAWGPVHGPYNEVDSASGKGLPVQPSAGAIFTVTSTGNVASGAADSGNPVKVGGVYHSAGVTLTDGQRGDLQLDSAGRLLVSPLSNVLVRAAQQGGWTVTLDADASVTPGAAPANSVLVGVVYNATPPAPASGQAFAMQADAAGNLKVSGTFWQATQPVSLASVPTHAVSSITTSVTPGTGAANLGKAEDAPHASGDTGVMALAVRHDVAGALAGADGDYIPLSTDANGSLWVRLNDLVAVDASGSVVTANAGTGTFNIQANAPVNVAQVNGVATSTGNGVSGTGVQRVTLASDSTGQVALAAGSALVGKVGIDQTTPGTTNAVTPVPATSGGPTLARVKSAASTNATNLKASAGQVYGWAFFNTTAAAKFVKFYNKASAPTVGTDTPVMTVPVPAGGGTNVEFSMGIPFGTGISYAITGSVADSDTTSTAADDVHGGVLYR